jgi:hypothetical protein
MRSEPSRPTQGLAIEVASLVGSRALKGGKDGSPLDLTAVLHVHDEASLEIAAEKIGRALGILLARDTSGRYEEYPAFVADVLGTEIALLGPPQREESCTTEPMFGFQLLMRTYADAPDDGMTADLSVHLAYLLRVAGIRCEISGPDGTS